jgi:hypothetical protein
MINVEINGDKYLVKNVFNDLTVEEFNSVINNDILEDDLLEKKINHLKLVSNIPEEIFDICDTNDICIVYEKSMEPDPHYDINNKLVIDDVEYDTNKDWKVHSEIIFTRGQFKKLKDIIQSSKGDYNFLHHIVASFYGLNTNPEPFKKVEVKLVYPFLIKAIQNIAFSLKKELLLNDDNR